MEFETFRERDMAVERSLAKFLDEHLYTNPIFDVAKRTDDFDNQKIGSDIILSIPSLGLKNIIVDEKSQSSKVYINNPLPTFALELSFMNRINELMIGWFIDKTKITTHYMLLWIKKCLNADLPKPEDFQEVEYVLVSRRKLLNYFYSEGLTIERLEEKAHEIRENKIYGPSEKKPMYKFFFTNNIKELPINLVVNKKIYMQFADLKGIVTSHD